MNICGQVETIVFSSKENNYYIFKVVDEENNRFTLCGYLPQLELDLTYDFTVEEVNHKKYGLQYNVLAYQVRKEYSKAGIVNYLSSNLFPGVGLITAEAIYDALGDNALELIENDPSILDKIERINQNQKKIIYERLNANRILEELYVKLYQFGLTSKMILKLYELYGDTTLLVIEENPYRLIYDLEGVGFKKADELAMKLGFSLDNLERLKALLVYTMLNISSKNGLTYLTLEQLLNSSYNYGLKESNIDISILEKSLNEAINSNLLVCDNNRIYLPSIYYSEVRIGQKISQMLDIKVNKYNKKLFDSLILEFEKINSIKFADLQKEAIINALENRVSIITGGPGTGKTTIIKAIIQIYAGLHGINIYDDEIISKILLCAPTGKAAKRMSEKTNFFASTIHRALGYNFENEFAFNSSNLLPQHLIIIDETSMIDTILAYRLLDAVSINAQIVFVGDAFQLPSILPGAILKDLIESKSIKTTYLQTIYRQEEGSNIIRLAEDVKDGNVDVTLFNKENDLTFIPANNLDIEDKIISLIKKLNDEGFTLDEDIEVLIPIYKGICGIDRINRLISDNFNLNYEYSISKKDKIFKENDKVIQLTNSKELEIMNGDIGFLGKKKMMLVDDKDKDVFETYFVDRKVKLLEADFENLNLAYAISIHKAQGSEFPIVILPMLFSYSVMLKRKLIYTAITRAKSRLYIIGDYNAFLKGLNEIELNRQTSLLLRINHQNEVKVFINDPEIPFDYLGEYDMEGISPYSFMV